jgi:hypothetical protein
VSVSTNIYLVNERFNKNKKSRQICVGLHLVIQSYIELADSSFVFSLLFVLLSLFFLLVFF